MCLKALRAGLRICHLITHAWSALLLNHVIVSAWTVSQRIKKLCLLQISLDNNVVKSRWFGQYSFAFSILLKFCKTYCKILKIVVRKLSSTRISLSPLLNMIHNLIKCSWALLNSNNELHLKPLVILFHISFSNYPLFPIYYCFIPCLEAF